MNLGTYNFNTAILYDVENLLKGYNFSQQIAHNLSLEKIVKEIKKTNRLGQIAIQRAYANWSDPRLAIMRGEINELGIDPIQVFGFSRDQKKNAADIQLAIDAIDLAHIRHAIEIVVIVSGDGGFASLAKKLHEYGKVVIGCAYQNATNKIFKAVCDDFVWIPDPDEEEVDEDVNPACDGTSQASKGTDPHNTKLASKIKKAVSLEHDVVIEKTKEVLHWYASQYQDELSKTGIHLSVIQEGLKITIPGFRTTRFGFLKFTEFLQYACQGTSLCIARQPNSQATLFLRNSVPNGFEILPELEVQNFQSVEGYRSILATGIPTFRFPQANEMEIILKWLVDHPPEDHDLSTLIEYIMAGLHNTASSESVKHTLLCLCSADTFICKPNEASIWEQKLTLKQDLRLYSKLIAKLQEAAKIKLMESLGQVSESILKEIVPDAS